VIGNRKGYFFLVDAFIGSAIILVSLAIILGSNVKVTPLYNDYSASEEYASFIVNTQIEDLNNPYVNNLVSTGVITNTKNTIIDQVAQFYYNAYYICPAIGTCRTDNMTFATQMVRNITDPLFTEKYGFEYVIRDYKKNMNLSIYNRSLNTRGSANLVVVSKKITFLQINSTEMFGPEIVDIIVWV